MSLTQQIQQAIRGLPAALGDLMPKGQLVTRVASAYVPGESVTYTESSLAVDVIIDRFDAKEIDGTIVQVADVQLYLLNCSNVPDTNDLVRVAGQSYRIIRILPTFAGSTPVMYLLHGRPA